LLRYLSYVPIASITVAAVIGVAGIAVAISIMIVVSTAAITGLVAVAISAAVIPFAVAIRVRMESTMARCIAAALFETLAVSFSITAILIAGIVITVPLTERPRRACQQRDAQGKTPKQSHWLSS
jgi:hypothetical protein